MKSLFKSSSTPNTQKLNHDLSSPLEVFWKTLAQKTFSKTNLSLSTVLLTTSIGFVSQLAFLPQKSLADSSACVGVFSTNSGGILGFLNTVNNSYTTILNFSATSTNINAAAVQPGTGRVYFVNRNNRQISYYDTNTNTTTTLATALPTSVANAGGGSALTLDISGLVGATFDNSATPKLYLFYGSNGILVEVNPSTGTIVGGGRKISNLPLVNGMTNGDIGLSTSGQLYLIGHPPGGTAKLHQLTVTSTTASVDTGVTINGLGTNLANGLAISPVDGAFYISASNGTYSLNTSVSPHQATRLSSNLATDLAACGTPTPNKPTISKEFSPSTVVGLPATSTLTLTLGNSNLVPIYLTQELKDTFPAGLVVATPNNLGGTCKDVSGNTVTADPGSDSISLNNGAKLPVGGCTISVNVTASSAGTYTNTIAAGALRTIVGDSTSTTTSTFVVSSTPRDYGDAPDQLAGTGTGNYQTVSADNGPSHTIVSGIALGTNIDADSGTLENTNADADDADGTPNDEDGVKIGASSLQNQTLTQGANVTLNITTQGSGQLSAWIDWNADGDFLDAGEKIATDVAPTSNAISLPITVPVGASIGTSYARFRYSSQTGLLSTGAASDGEVEDYKIAIAAAPKIPKLLLLKRITAINGNTTNNPNDNTPLNQFVDGGTNNDDNNANWPTPQNTYLSGAINGGLVKPNDEVEYTIYFLNTDAESKNVKICDLVPDGQTFVEDAYNNASPHPVETDDQYTSADTGIALGFDSTGLPATPTVYLTNIKDTNTGDRGQFYPAGDPNTPAMCKKFDGSGGFTSGVAANTDGAVVVEVVKGTDTIPPATGAGTPSNSYGFIRFRAKVK